MGTKAGTPHTSGSALNKCPLCAGNVLRRSAAGSASAAGSTSHLEMGMFSKTTDDASRASSNSEETDSVEAVDFPQTQSFWEGRGPYLLLGSGIRYFKLGFVKVKVRQTCSKK